MVSQSVTVLLVSAYTQMLIPVTKILDKFSRTGHQGVHPRYGYY